MAKENGSNNIEVFVAPLSAVVTFVPKALRGGTNDQVSQAKFPDDFYVPIFPMIRELQNVLYLQSYDSLSPSEPKIWYYNNSTAEECVAIGGEKITQIYRTDKVDEFSKYLDLISGDKKTKSGLNPGDGIVVWPPLTDVFEGATFSNGVLVRKKGSDAKFSAESQIMLFADKEMLNHSDKQIATLFLKALVLEMRSLQRSFRTRNFWQVWMFADVFSRWRDEIVLIWNHGLSYSESAKNGK